MRPAVRRLLPAVALLAASTGAGAGDIALIIDDLGFRADTDRRSLNLPDEVAVAIIPGAPMAGRLDRQAHDQGRDILIHLPLTDTDHPGCRRVRCLRPADSTDSMRRALDTALREIPHARGLNNHMGSGFTSDPLAALRLMASLADVNHRHDRGLYVIDSRTSAASRITEAASVFALPTARRDIFLDHDPDPEAIGHQWQRALHIAKRNGRVLVIGHPHPATLAFLETALTKLADHGVRLIRVPEIVDQETPWQPHSFPLQRVSKSSRPLPSSTCCGGQTSGSP